MVETKFHAVLNRNLIYQVKNQEEYDKILSAFPWDADIPDDITFPYSFPFSGMAPKVYQQVKEFIYACLKFSEDLNLRYWKTTNFYKHYVPFKISVKLKWTK